MLKAKLLGATAGAEEALAIEDVFSTYLYTGTGAAQTITNGIDLAGEGGLVWIKPRIHQFGNSSHWLLDTLRGINSAIRSNTDNAAINPEGSYVSAFNSTGFSLGVSGNVNNLNDLVASWTFRQAPRFFDVVTYTGDGVNSRTIGHSLGVAPGFVIAKRLDSTGEWMGWHRANGGINDGYVASINQTSALTNIGGNLSFTATTFMPHNLRQSNNTSPTANVSGATYVAYLFAHDPLGPSGDGSDGLIACGSYTGNGSNTAGPFINLGWEPQWILVKSSSASWDWMIVDNMRGMPAYDKYSNTLRPNTAVEESESHRFNPSATGFQVNDDNALVNANGGTYIYIAIRRGPMREPTVGTQVFNALTYVGNQTNGTTFSYANTPHIDLSLSLNRTNYFDIPEKYAFVDRLRGSRKTLNPQASTSERNNGLAFKDNSSTYQVANDNTGNFNYNGHGFVSYAFTRAPGFFDVVAYTGTGSAIARNHNLTVLPELIITKARTNVGGQMNWYVGHYGLNQYATSISTNPVNNTSLSTFAPVTTTTFVPLLNTNTGTFISYLFASLPGISKVGSYTGNGSSQTINCAFTTGARFVLIKRADSTGDWYVWDTARGIVSGNDPHLSLNTTAAEVTSDDTIDPDSTGFIVNQVAATNVNVNAATYIFLAIA
jgi:hypothetical protein